MKLSSRLVDKSCYTQT